MTGKEVFAALRDVGLLKLAVKPPTEAEKAKLGAAFTLGNYSMVPERYRAFLENVAVKLDGWYPKAK